MNNLITNFLESLTDSPLSSSESTMLYNSGKLLEILQDKELETLKFKPEELRAARLLSAEFGSLTSRFNNKIEGAFDQYNSLEINELKNFTGYLYLYVKQWALSVKALYYYRTSDFNSASNFTLECIALNEILIRKGLSTLVLRCAEQNRNIARIFIASKKYTQGYSLAGDILVYLLNGEPRKLLGTVFKDKIFGQQTNIYVKVTLMNILED